MAFKQTANMTFQEALAQSLMDEYGLSEAKIKDLFRAAERSFNAYVDKYGQPIERDFVKVKEKVEILDGSRNKVSLEKSAVRFQDLRYLKQFPSLPPKSRYIGSAPTQADYNALQEDVKKLYELLGSMGVIIGARV